MKRLLIAAMLASGTALAQIPVTDGASIIQRTVEHGLTMIEMAEQLKQLVDQYNQLQATHQALTGVRNLGDVFDNPALRQYLPDDWVSSYQALKTAGYGGLVRKGIEIYSDNKVHDACAHHTQDDMRLNCEAQAVQASQDQGDVMEAIILVTERAEQLRELQSQINATTDPKAISELQARISIEQAAIANESTRLELMARITAAEDRVLQQRNDEFQARTFDKTKGVTIEPLTFGD